MMNPFRIAAWSTLLLTAPVAQAQNRPPVATATEKADSEKPIDVREHYTKYEYRIPMRDGAKLFTAVYVPKDLSTTYPFLVNRTPYSVSASDGADGSRNYSVDHFPPETRHLGPSEDRIHLCEPGCPRALPVRGKVRRDVPAQ